MNRIERGIIYGIALVAFGILMAVWHFLLAGISADFGAGFAVGAAVTFGMLAILVKSVRDLP